MAMVLMAPALAQSSPEITKRVIEATAIYKEGKVDEALARFQDLQKDAPENADVLSWLGFIYLRKDMAGDAVPVLEKALAIRGNDLEIRNNLGNAYVATGQDDKALEQYSEIAKLNTRLYEPHYNIGGIHLRKQNYAQAVDAYKKALELNKNDGFVYNNLGLAYEGVGDYAEAANCYGKAVDLRPDSVLFNRNAGFANMRLNRPKSAITYLEKASAGETDAATSLALSQAYAAEGRADDAKRTLEAVEAALGDSSTYWYNVGVLRTRTGDIDGAKVAYEKAIAMNDADADSLNNYALLLYRHGEYAAALPVFERLVALDPANGQNQLNVAACALKSGDLDKAMGIWRGFLHKNPKRDDIRLDFASALWKKGDYEGARYHYVEVTKSQPNNVRALNGVGLYQYQMDKLDDASKTFQRILSLDSSFLPAYNNLAVTYERQNKMAQAIALLEKALAIDPNFEDAKRNLERMKK